MSLTGQTRAEPPHDWVAASGQAPDKRLLCRYQVDDLRWMQLTVAGMVHSLQTLEYPLESGMKLVWTHLPGTQLAYVDLAVTSFYCQMQEYCCRLVLAVLNT
jgi:hypothetical protein